jgi:hypothetical protein
MAQTYTPSSNGNSDATGRGDGDRVKQWEERRQQAKQHRKRFEPDWRICQSFVANKQWIGWDRREHRVISLLNDPREKDREHYTVNIVNQYVRTILGKLYTDDFRPDIQYRTEDVVSVDYARQADRAFAYAWDVEIGAEEALFEALLAVCIYGTSATRCRFDPTLGPYKMDVPMINGKPMLEGDKARAAVAGAAALGHTVSFQSMHEGKIVWEPLLPDMLLPPAGVKRETNFPWLIVETLMSVEAVKSRYGDKAKGLVEQDLSAIDSDLSLAVGPDDASGESAKLRGHLKVSTGYEFPNSDYHEGRMDTWAQDTMLEPSDQLPYEVNGERKAGIAFFHYNRLPQRFWSMGVVEPLIGVQRQRNRAASQRVELKDRMGLGRVFVEKGAVSEWNPPKGKIGEVIEIRPGMRMPVESTGPGVGDWIQAEVEIADRDADKVAGLREVSMGAAPAGVSAYSAMALLKEEDDRRVGPVLKGVRESVEELTHYTLSAIRQYWPDNKQIMVAGDTGALDAFLFVSSKLPPTAYVRVGKGAAVPRSQAAEIQKIFDLYDRSIQGGQPIPFSWLFESLKVGQAQPLPKQEVDVQRGKAQLENMLLVRGEPVQPVYYDNDQIHLAEHRAAQAQYAMIPGAEGQAQAIEQHIQMHTLNAQQKGGMGSVPQLQGPMGQQGQAPPANPMVQNQQQGNPMANIGRMAQGPPPQPSQPPPQPGQ